MRHRIRVLRCRSTEHTLRDLRMHARQPESPEYDSATTILRWYHEYREAHYTRDVALDRATARWQGQP